MNEGIYNEIELLKGEVTSINRNVNMIADRITNIVKSEVKIQLTKQNLYSVISQRVEQEIKDNFNNYLKTVIESMSKTIINKFKREMDVAKNLAYSTDKSIQHALMKSGCSQEEHEIFMNRMDGIFKTMENKMLNISKKDLLQIGGVNEGIINE